MGLFGEKRKGSDSLKTLSEKDIQSRLYGHLRTGNVIQEDFPALSKPKQESQVFQKSLETAKILTPSASTTKTAGPDLFTEAPRRTEEEISPKLFESSKSSSPASRIHFQKQAQVPAPSRSFVQILQGIASAVTQVLKQIVFKFVEAFATAVSALIGIVASVDFRKPAVRRVAYVAASILALVLIFTGIHHLNKNREIAMKSPHRKAAEAPKKHKIIHPSEPLESALSETVAEAPSVPAAAKASDVKEKAPAKAAPVTEPKKMKASAEPVKAETPAAATATTGKTSGAVIQVATFATQEDAGKLVEKFKTAGFSSFFKSVSRSGGRVYYCVYIGKFQTQQEAEAKLAEFKKQEVARSFQDAFVRSL